MATPNLSTDVLSARVSRDGYLIYLSTEAIANDRHIPLAVLKMARKHGAPGFANNRSDVNYSRLQPWLVTNFDSMQIEVQRIEDSKAPVENLKREKLELQKLKEEVTKLRNYNRAQDKDFISRKIVISTLGKVIKDFSTTATRIFEHEQPVKCNGMPTDEITKHNREYLDTLFASMITTLRDWQSASDLAESTNDNTAGHSTDDTASDSNT